MPKITLPAATLVPSTFGRRIWSSLYELALLFGIVFVTAFLVQIILTLLHLSLPHWAHQIIFFVTVGVYFVYCWTHGGQTLAQRTWHLKTLTTDGRALSMTQAWLRYALSYLGVMPAFLIAWTLFHRHAHMPSAASSYTIAIILALMNWLALLGTSLAHPLKIALHERLSRSRTVWVNDQ